MSKARTSTVMEEVEGFVMNLRGLPFSATEDDILKFFDGINVKSGRAGIHILLSREGRPSGEAFVEVESEDDCTAAEKKDRQHIGERYIEVRRAKRSEMDWALKRQGAVLSGSAVDQCCMRLQGLPYECKKEDVEKFLEGLEIVPNGITIPHDYAGRCTGVAYIQFVDKENAEKALLRHKEKIGHRYIEVYKTRLSEIRIATNNFDVDRPRAFIGGGFGRPGPYDRFGGGMGRFGAATAGRRMRGFNGGGWGGDWNGSGLNPFMTVHMRGLPFKATEADIADFFKPIVPVNILLLTDDAGRSSGEADVEFSSVDDAQRALQRHKSNMGDRYIELYMEEGTSSKEANGRGTGGFGGFKSLLDY
ncbi:hypothetical protein M8J76_006849 [Diaphorina citri]|nr:hypothetical protein M8J76_006849 [Diaphorina citri]KAI5756238.1 hypothetical protein M8J77_023278 [Diaphorina citri]